MFDDIPNKNSNPPQNLPTEPVDMFAGVEEGGEPTPGTQGPSALDAGILRKKPAGMQVPPAEIAQGGEPTVYSVKEPVLGKVIGFFIFLIVAAGVGYGGWRLYSYLTQKSDSLPAETNNLTEQQNQTPVSEEPVEDLFGTEPATLFDTSTESMMTSTETGNEPIIFGEAIDTDKDGLDDTREEEAGTDMSNPDTDEDGLTDGDEVIIWKTNPLNPDSDGDSYLDGDEVRHGYSPLGPGKLFNDSSTVTSSVVTSTATTSTAEDDIINETPEL